MHAVVMAAGEGTRLRPLTEHWPKPVLPIDGRPVIATLLRELAAAGCERVYVVTGHLAEQVEELFGDGSGFALDVRYVRQPSVLVTAADTVYAAGDVKRFVEAAQGAAGAVSYRLEPAPDPPHRYAVRVVEGRVERVLDDDPANPKSAAPLMVLGPEVVPFLEGLPGPPTEVAGALQRGIDAGLAIAGIEIGKTRDLTHPEDLVKENFRYLGT